MSEQENAQFMQGAYDKFNAGDIDGLLSMMADNVEWVLPDMSNVPFAGARSGHASVAAFFKSVLEHQEPKSFDVHGMIAQGNRVVAHGHYVWHVKATGRDFEGDYVHIWTVAGGKITRLQEYTDTASAVAAYAA